MFPKYYLAFLLFLGWFHFSFAWVLPKTDWEKNRLQGKVKTMIAEEIEYKTNGKKQLKKKVLHFNEKGYLLLEEDYREQALNYTQEYRYDQEGKLLYSKSYADFEYDYQYKKDKKGNMIQTKIERRRSEEQDYQSKNTIYYDELGRKVREVARYGLRREPYADSNFYYDSKGRSEKVIDNYFGVNIYNSYQELEEGKYQFVTLTPGKKWISIHDKYGYFQEEIYITQPSSQIEPIVQYHYLFENALDSYHNIIFQKIYLVTEKQEKGELYRDIKISYEYYDK